MSRTPPWSEQGPVEFDNAKEAMEKLVMSRLHNYTFSPAVAASGKWPVQTDDLDRDAVLDDKVCFFAWVQERHLDLPTIGSSAGFIDFAVQELLKINHYKAPRDKLICILNVCKVIFGLIRQMKDQEVGADTFLPLLILVVLRAKCPHLVSNVEYISHFRSPERLTSESGYYLTSLQGAITFIAHLECSSLSNITTQEFDYQVELATQRMTAEAEQRKAQPKLDPPQPGLLELAGSGVQTLKDVLVGPSANQEIKSTSSHTPPANTQRSLHPLNPNSQFTAETGTQGQSSHSASSSNPTDLSSHDHADRPARETASTSGTPAPPTTSSSTDPLAGGGGGGFGALTAPLANASLAEDTRQFFQRTGEAARQGIGRPIGALGKLWNEATAPQTDSSSTTVYSGDAGGRGASLNAPPVPGGKPTLPGPLGRSEAEASSGGGAGGRVAHPERVHSAPPSTSLSASPSTPPHLPPPQRNRFLSMLSEGLVSEPHSPGAVDRSLDATPESVQGAPSLKLPLPSWARTAMGQSEEVTASHEAPSKDVTPAFHADGRNRLSDFTYRTDQSPLPADPRDIRSARAPARHPDGDLVRFGPGPRRAPTEPDWQSFQEQQEQQVQANLETLAVMFPGMERSVCRLVFESCGGNLEDTIDKLLAMG